MKNKQVAILYQDAKRLCDCGKLLQAQPLLKRACEIDAENCEMWKMRGDIETALQHYKDAQVCYEHVLSCDVNNAMSRYALAEIRSF